MNRENKDKVIIAVLTLAVIIFAVSAISMFFININKNYSIPENNKGLSIAENAEKWDKTLDDLNNKESGIKIPGYGSVTITENTKEADITLVNPEGNPCYFEYVLEADGNVLYKSDLIEPGKAVKKVTLENVPKPGTYKLVMKINTYGFDENLSPLNGAEVKTTLVVT